MIPLLLSIRREANLFIIVPTREPPFPGSLGTTTVHVNDSQHTYFSNHQFVISVPFIDNSQFLPELISAANRTYRYWPAIFSDNAGKTVGCSAIRCWLTNQNHSIVKNIVRQ